jgi:hypothetical protein
MGIGSVRIRGRQFAGAMTRRGMICGVAKQLWPFDPAAIDHIGTARVKATAGRRI